VCVTSIPVACTLSADDTTARFDEWQQFLIGDVVEIARTGTVARLRLKEGDGALLGAADLARREKACCAFFEFRLVLLPEAVWLEVEAPDEATPILDELVSLGPA
jgi:hypothetical protein